MRDLDRMIARHPAWYAGLLRGAAMAREMFAAEPDCPDDERRRHWAKAAEYREEADEPN